MSVVLKDLKRIKGPWRSMFVLNVGITVVCSVAAFWPPFNWLSVVNGICAGAGASNAINSLFSMSRDRAFNAMVDAFNAMEALTNDILEQWRNAELTAAGDIVDPHDGCSLH